MSNQNKLNFKNLLKFSPILIFAGIILALFFLQLLREKPSQPMTADNQEMPENIVQPLGLSPVPWPADNPYTREKAELGRILYFDKRLSANDTVSCADCHNAPCGYSDCRKIAIGINKNIGTRHSPTVLNAAYSPTLFWDGRANSLEAQCHGPLGNPNEMSGTPDAHQALSQCVNRIKDIKGYQTLFKAAFGNDTPITMEEISKAIATFERTLLTGNSPYDRYNAGDKKALSEDQLNGFKVFMKAGCANCHRGENFTDYRFQNIGVGMDAKDPDLGRYNITHDKKDWGSFKVPGLREVSKSAPYMHDGSIATLEGVIDYYDKGGIKNKNLHPLMKPLHLTEKEKRELLYFMYSLNGEGWQHFHEPKSFPQ